MKIRLETPLSQIIANNPFRVTFPEEEVDASIIDKQKLHGSIEEVKINLGFKLQSADYSTFLLKQLAIHRINGYEKYAGEFHQYHYPSLIETLRIHNNSGNVNERIFRGNKLNQFKHIHHNSNTFVVKNLENYWKSKWKGQYEIEYQNKLLNQKYQELVLKTLRRGSQKKSTINSSY